MSKDFQPANQEICHGIPLRQYWESKDRFGLASANNIDWQANHTAIKTLIVSRRHWVTKHVSGHCGTGKMMVRWKQRESDACPRCNEPEDASHIWLCKHPESITVWRESIETLRSWLIAQQTHPSITAIICSRLLEWKTGIPYSPLDSSFLGLRATVALQDLVGWQAFLEGCPVLGWQETQQRFYNWIGSRRTGARYQRPNTRPVLTRLSISPS